MRFATRIFLAYFLLVGLGTALFLNSALNQLRPAIRQASEEALVDTANLLAELVGVEFDKGFGETSDLALAISKFRQRPVDAQIWSLRKTRSDFVIYITDQHGTVLFHSEEPLLVGADFSRWNDVRLTLSGKYGARTTQAVPGEELSSYMYVAAPIRRNGDIIGSVTVSQPNASIQPFQQLASRQIWQQGAAILLIALLLGALMAMWLARSVNRLLQYVESVRRGEKVVPPALREPELAALAVATDRMRLEIEGKEYVENYIHNLAHEMKSPLSAIRGAAEILQDMPDTGADAARFLDNIDTESARIQRLIDRLLSLASLEKRNQLQNATRLDLTAVLNSELARKLVAIEKKSLQVQSQNSAAVFIVGEEFLLRQALSNLLDNAIEFSPAQGRIVLKIEQDSEQTRVQIENTGPAIPDYAVDKIFDRFFSLPRPDHGRKSTGLGLSFVKEVAALHRGHITICNVPGGVKAEFSVPRDP